MSRWCIVVAGLVLVVGAACSSAGGTSTAPSPSAPSSTSAVTTTTAVAVSSVPPILLRAEWRPPHEIPIDVRSALVGILEERGMIALLPSPARRDDIVVAYLRVATPDAGPEVRVLVADDQRPPELAVTVTAGETPCDPAWERVEVRGRPGCSPPHQPTLLRWTEGGHTIEAAHWGMEREEVTSWLATWETVP